MVVYTQPIQMIPQIEKGEKYIEEWLLRTRLPFTIEFPELLTELLNYNPTIIMQPNWNPSLIDLGTLKVNQTTKLVFTYIGPNPEYIQQTMISASCGCTETKWNPEDNTITAIYTPTPVPLHFKQQGKHSYNSEKYIVINFGNRVDKLTFTAVVIE